MVLDEWGMRQGGGRGSGISALFAGPSGTGKTMAAEVIAYELGFDLYTVDLKNTSSGETMRTTTFKNADSDRGVAKEKGEPAGYIGLQSYPGSPIAFRNIRIKEG